MSTGRVTLPIEEGIGDLIPAIMSRLGADAVRNSDGTRLPESATQLGATVYATYFVGRGDQEWALAHPECRTRVYLSSARTPAPECGELRIAVMAQWLAEQVDPDLDCDVSRWWQVIDRTTGATVEPARWRVEGTGATTEVVLDDPVPFHVYTVGFLAYQNWDPTQMYNYLTNGWQDDPSRVKERPYDARHPETWQHITSSLRSWLAAHPEVDVVRFTTFFYHFTLVFGADYQERFVDWFGYGATVSVPAMEEFAARTGRLLTAEDFVDQGYYNTSFRVPSDTFRAWVDYQHEWVAGKVAELVAIVHEAGKEAMMFLGDNWIGTEPYGPHFAATRMDAVVGSVGSAATCRMISDIPGVRYTEGRFLPYFFPDVFRPGGDPVAEAHRSWVTARRAIVRSPLDRIGYGGYLSLALTFPEFIDCIEAICDEFRELHEKSGGETPADAPFTVAILNQWGALRSWQTHMVAHALHYRETYSCLGVLESLAGLPFDVRFLSFDDIHDGVPAGIDVLINVGTAGTAFSGGSAWLDERVQVAVRRFVLSGGGFVGVGEPTSATADGAVLQLTDMLGVEQENGWSLSTTRRPVEEPDHFITADLTAAFDPGEGTADIYPSSDRTQVVRLVDGQVQIAVHPAGRGRSVYLSGLPYTPANARLLHRALYWAAGRESDLTALGLAADPRVEVAWYPRSRRVLLTNVALEPVLTNVLTPLGPFTVSLEPGGHRWIDG